MSWSFSGVGTPKALQQAIDRACDGYSAGVSRDEFEAVRAPLKALLAGAHTGAAVSLSASGHGTYDATGTRTYASISVSLTQLGALVLETPPTEVG